MPELSDKIARLRQVKFDLAHQQGILDVIKAEKEQLSEEILAELKAMPYDQAKFLMKSKSMSITQKPIVKVLDPVKVAFWLRMNEYNPDDYMKLDALKVRPLLEEAAIKSGEIIEGAEVQMTEYITLRREEQK